MPHTYITTPIYYVNGDPHLGSAYTMIITDTIARYYRARGWDTFYLTGTDEHGNKIAQAAADAGVGVKEFTDRVSASFRAAWDMCDITYDHFIRTTDDYHIRYVQEFLQKVHDAGDIYFHRYEGLYCFGCERFYTPKELRDGKCPDHLTAPTLIEEENYFFRMSKYQERLLAHIEANPDFIRPEGFKNEVQVFVTVISADQEHDADVLGALAASAALKKNVISGPTVRLDPLAKHTSNCPPDVCGSTPSTSRHGSRPHSSDCALYQ